MSGAAGENTEVVMPGPQADTGLEGSRLGNYCIMHSHPDARWGGEEETGAAEEVGAESIRGQGPGPGSAAPLSDTVDGRFGLRTDM